MFQFEYKKSIKDITILILLILLISTSITSFIYYNQFDKAISQKNKNINSTTLIERISRISELATTKYYYSNVVSYKNNMVVNNVEIPFTGKGFLIKYDGYIKAGIDLNSIEVISQSNDSIEISVSKSKVLDHSIDEKSIHVYDEKSSVFNNISIKEVFDIISKEKKDMEDKIIENGILEEANKNTTAVLRDILENMGFTNINIIFREQ